MKKATGIISKILLGLFLVIIILLFTVPVVFKGRIKEKVETLINSSLNAKVDIGDYKLGFFRNFPNLTFSLNQISVKGIDKFENDTLVKCESVDLVFNLASLFKSSGYEIKSVIIDNAMIKALILRDGSVNWDIMKSDDSDTEASEEPSTLKVLLEKIEMSKSSVAYIDQESNMAAYISSIDASMSGDMTGSVTNLKIKLNAGELTFIMDDVKYLNKATADAEVNVRANIDSMRFDLMDNYFRINDLKLNCAGMVSMPGDDIETDLTFSTEETSFKSLLSIIPSFYMSDFKDLTTDGEFSLKGSAKGVYSDADSTLPDIDLSLSVKNGLISYPALPEKIRNINISSDVFVDGRDMDKSTVNVNSFHIELAGNPFDMKFALKTPVSDPDFNAEIRGKIDLTALSKAMPLDSIDLAGLIDVSVTMAGRMSVLEMEQYDRFKASGTMNINKMLVSMTGYPEIMIEKAGFSFSPAFAGMNDARLQIGKKSDFVFNGKIENYIPYIFKNDVVRGNLSMSSNLIDLTDIMSGMAEDTTSTDTAALSVIKIPENIDFSFYALIDRFVYDNIDVKNVKGTIKVKEGIMSLKDAGMDFLGGTIAMNADYDTRDSLKPTVKADMSMENIGVKDAFNSFNTIQKLVPTADGINGKVAVKLSYNSLLGNDLMPVVSTINGGGKLVTNEVTLVESAVYSRIKETLKLGNNYSNTFKDLNISFKINDGRIFVSPFNTKVGNIKMNIGGDQGIDQTINYVIKTEIPRADLGNSVNSLINNLTAQASSYGITFKPSETLKVNVKVSGTLLKPVVSPFFGKEPSDSSAVASSVKETVKSIVDEKLGDTKENVRAKAEIEADKLVQEAESKAQLLRDEAAKTAEKIRQEADVQAQRLIKEAESKGTIARLAAQKTADTVKKEADKKADQVTREADEKANKIVEEAKTKKEEMLNRL